MYVCLQPTYERNSCEARITGIRGPQALALAPYSEYIAGPRTTSQKPQPAFVFLVLSLIGCPA
jgi:hypothetical protein